MFLGIDIGTTATKATLYTLEGQAIGKGYSEYQVTHPQPTWAEQDPKIWLKAMKEAISQAFGELKPNRSTLTGICVSAQSPTLVAVDKSGEPVHPAMIWLDNRATEESERVNKKIGVEHIYKLIGIRPSPSLILQKILWLRNHRKKIFDKVRCFHQAKDYIVNQLTGERVIDVIHAAGYLCFDLQKQQEDFSIYDEFDLDKSKIPSIKPCNQVIGETIDDAQQYGIPVGVPVINGSIDAIMAMLGMGILRPNITCEVAGTSTVLTSSTEKPIVDPLQRYNINIHPLGNMWLIASLLSTTGAVLKWFRDNIWRLTHKEHDGSKEPYDLFSEWASRSPPGARGLIMLPYLHGERAPYWDPKAKGVFFGLTMQHTLYDMVRSIMEASALASLHNIEELKKLGLDVREVRISGGPSQSGVWNQIKADAYGVPLHKLEVAYPENQGNAILTGITLKQLSIKEAEKWISIQDTFSPSMRNHRIYKELLGVYLKLYERTNDIMTRI